MKLALCTLCLNESEFLEKNYQQHKDWPDMVAWAFVHGADPKYAQAAPEMVNSSGLSTDSTAEILMALAANDSRLRVNHFGWMTHPLFPEQNKCTGRNAYLTELERVQPDAFLVVDADEFYTRQDQLKINQLLQCDDFHYYLAWRFTQRHLWRPPSIGNQSPFELEARGGYWQVPHTRLFKWRTGIRYKKNHNLPESAKYRPMSYLNDCRFAADGPQCVHLGFARSQRERKATNSYYQARGEGTIDGRWKYVACRSLWETWQPGQPIPDVLGARIVKYEGPIPECYQLTGEPTALV